jgi:hypothetical protein
MTSSFKAVCEQYNAQVEIPNSDSKPFETFYAGRSILEKALASAASFSDFERVRLLALLGKNFEHCEEPHKASESMQAALRLFLSLPVTVRYSSSESVNVIAGLLNYLSSLWSGRGDGMRGLHYALLAKRVLSGNESFASAFSKISNTFQLARALGSIKRPDLASVLCCHTLDLQLQYNIDGGTAVDDDPWVNCCNREWLRRCADLAVYFVNEGLFWSAEYLLHC